MQEGAFTHHSSLSSHYSKLGLEEPRVRGWPCAYLPLPPDNRSSLSSHYSKLGLEEPRVRGWPCAYLPLPPDNRSRSSRFLALPQRSWVSGRSGESRSRPPTGIVAGLAVVPGRRRSGVRADCPAHLGPTAGNEAHDPPAFGYRDLSSSLRATPGAAEQQGKTIYDELVQAHRERLAREREKGEYAFAARRRAIERIGLPQVRNHRLSLLEQEEERFREQLECKAQILPALQPVLVLRVEWNDKDFK